MWSSRICHGVNEQRAPAIVGPLDRSPSSRLREIHCAFPCLQKVDFLDNADRYRYRYQSEDDEEDFDDEDDGEGEDEEFEDDGAAEGGDDDAKAGMWAR